MDPEIILEAEAFEIAPGLGEGGTLDSRGLWDGPTAPWSRVRAGVNNTQYLAFMNLDQFDWKRAVLTPRLKQYVALLAEHVRLSWKSLRPIGHIRLIGHTDNTGTHNYNVDLGDRRAQAVKDALEKLLREDILQGHIAISVETSPGELKPVGDNRTSQGRALNRRVEALIAPPEPPRPTLQWPPHVSPPREDPFSLGKGGIVPTLPRGKTLRQWFDESFASVPKFLRDQIWKAIFDKDWGAMSQLLGVGGFSGGAKEAMIETARALSEGKKR
jgi:outer membrane protein OmpA-like peptidoglycan-associated protein